MVEGAYEKIEGTKAKKLLERLNKNWPGSPFEAERTVIHARPLSFAPGWSLAEVEDAKTMPEKKCTILDNGQECTPVEYTSSFITGFMKKQGFTMNEDQAQDYMYFWFEYARTGAERFVLVENLDDIPWREDVTPQGRKSLAKVVTKSALEHTSADGFTYTTTLLFRDTLLHAKATVSPQGDVKIARGEIIAENLTVIDTLTGF